jgi:hypothetical protein
MVDYSAYEHGVRDEVYNHDEPNLWSYFVEGVPVLLLDTISSVRMLVNGSPGLLDSLTTTNPADLALIERAYNTGYNNSATVTVTLIAVNVAVGRCLSTSSGFFYLLCKSILLSCLVLPALSCRVLLVSLSLSLFTISTPSMIFHAETLYVFFFDAPQNFEARGAPPPPSHTLPPILPSALRIFLE